ncbi:flavodoxin domain-containing protein [Streptomyces sp. NPDC013161]|uniref:flavodoxin domain-containing protein n=1 Tax=Streptomyces sp. NPDC013161 TaxID=3364862 RepID=UPI0036A7331D
MPISVLVTYGTTNGSTAQIAESVADVLRKEGLVPDLLPARSVVDATPYDAVVVRNAPVSWPRGAQGQRQPPSFRRHLGFPEPPGHLPVMGPAPTTSATAGRDC